MSKDISRAKTTLTGMSSDGLTDGQRAELANAQAKAAWLESMMKKPAR